MIGVGGIDLFLLDYFSRLFCNQDNQMSICHFIKILRKRYFFIAGYYHCCPRHQSCLDLKDLILLEHIYYFVKLIKKTDTQVDFVSIFVPFKEFDNMFAKLKEENKISEAIELEEL